MDATDFIQVAERLCRSSAEADFRTSVGRAYYGAFHCVCEFLRKMGIRLPVGPEVHNKARWCIEQAGNQKLLLAARQLESLRRERNTADYDMRSTKFRRSTPCVAALEKATGIRDIMNAIEGEPIFPSISEAVREYASNTLSLVVSDKEDQK